MSSASFWILSLNSVVSDRNEANRRVRGTGTSDIFLRLKKKPQFNPINNVHIHTQLYSKISIESLKKIEPLKNKKKKEQI